MPGISWRMATEIVTAGIKRRGNMSLIRGSLVLVDGKRAELSTFGNVEFFQ